MLREYLPQVVRTTDRAISRVIVADNGSTDDSLAYVRATFSDEVGIISFDKNYGFAEGYNRAIALADGYEYVVLLNSDVATADGWDRILLDYMDSHPDCGACQPKLLSYRDKDTFEYAGACGGYLDRNGYPYCRGRIFGTCERDHGQYDTVADVFWASGACFFVRRGLYISAGGLDRAFFAHMEEIDLCWRIHLAGYSVAAVPSAVVYHLGGGSLPAENPKKTYLNFRNNLLMLHKNLPDSCRRGKLFRRRLLDTLAWARYVLTLDLPNAAAILKAHRDFARMCADYTDLPGSRSEAADVLSADVGSRVNILLSYYVRRRKRFSQIFPSCDNS